MEEEFRALLQANAAISAIASHINFGAHPQGQPLPAIVLNTVSYQEAMTLDGPNGLTDSRVQVDCYANGYGPAKQLSRAVLALCHGYRGGNFHGVMLIDASDSRTQQTYDATADQPYRVSLDFRVVHSLPEEGQP